MSFYMMDYKSIVEEYIVLENPTGQLDDRGYYASWFQFLDKELIEIKISEEGGIEYPDLIIQEDVPLISEKMKQLFDIAGVRYVFYKPVDIVDDYEMKKTRYYLAVPSRIDCLDYDKSIYDNECEFAETILIDEKKVGDAHIFKLRGLGNSEIIVTEKLFKILDREELEGVYFKQL